MQTGIAVTWPGICLESWYELEMNQEFWVDSASNFSDIVTMPNKY
jgi:hypothetical protein